MSSNIHPSQYYNTSPSFEISQHNLLPRRGRGRGFFQSWQRNAEYQRWHEAATKRFRSEAGDESVPPNFSCNTEQHEQLNKGRFEHPHEYYPCHYQQPPFMKNLLSPIENSSPKQYFQKSNSTSRPGIGCRRWSKPPGGDVVGIRPRLFGRLQQNNNSVKSGDLRSTTENSPFDTTSKMKSHILPLKESTCSVKVGKPMNVRKRQDSSEVFPESDDESNSSKRSFEEVDGDVDAGAPSEKRSKCEEDSHQIQSLVDCGANRERVRTPEIGVAMSKVHLDKTAEQSVLSRNSGHLNKSEFSKEPEVKKGMASSISQGSDIQRAVCTDEKTSYSFHVNQENCNKRSTDECQDFSSDGIEDDQWDEVIGHLTAEDKQEEVHSLQSQLGLSSPLLPAPPMVPQLVSPPLMGDLSNAYLGNWTVPNFLVPPPGFHTLPFTLATPVSLSPQTFTISDLHAGVTPGYCRYTPISSQKSVSEISSNFNKELYAGLELASEEDNHPKRPESIAQGEGAPPEVDIQESGQDDAYLRSLRGCTLVSGSENTKSSSPNSSISGTLDSFSSQDNNSISLRGSLDSTLVSSSESNKGCCKSSLSGTLDSSPSHSEDAESLRGSSDVMQVSESQSARGFLNSSFSGTLDSTPSGNQTLSNSNKGVSADDFGDVVRKAFNSSDDETSEYAKQDSGYGNESPLHKLEMITNRAEILHEKKSRVKADLTNSNNKQLRIGTEEDRQICSRERQQTFTKKMFVPRQLKQLRRSTEEVNPQTITTFHKQVHMNGKNNPTSNFNQDSSAKGSQGHANYKEIMKKMPSASHSSSVEDQEEHEDFPPDELPIAHEKVSFQFQKRILPSQNCNLISKNTLAEPSASQEPWKQFSVGSLLSKLRATSSEPSTSKPLSYAESMETGSDCEGKVVLPWHNRSGAQVMIARVKPQRRLTFQERVMQEEGRELVPIPYETSPSNEPIYPWSNEKYIDTHCHIDFLFNRISFAGTFAKYERVHNFPSNYEGCLAIFCTPESFHPENPLWQNLLKEDKIWGSFGCHPHHAKDYDEKVENHILAGMRHEKAIAFGEFGLDYSNRCTSPHNIQHGVFRRQLTLAMELGKPMVIHSREADDDTLEILIEMVPRDYKIHLHCFTGPPEVARVFLKTFPNSMIGITNLVTFPSAHETHRTVQEIPLDRILLETDAPYFYPRHCPKDGRWSHPAMAIFVAERIARLRHITTDEVLRIVRLNTKQMYGI